MNRKKVTRNDHQLISGLGPGFLFFLVQPKKTPLEPGKCPSGWSCINPGPQPGISSFLVEPKKTIEPSEPMRIAPGAPQARTSVLDRLHPRPGLQTPFRLVEPKKLLNRQEP